MLFRSLPDDGGYCKLHIAGLHDRCRSEKKTDIRPSPALVEQHDIDQETSQKERVCKMSPTEQFIEALERLKPGELGLLRTHAGQGIDESVEAFDLFAGLWWPLRQKYEKTPRRAVAWLIAKLYAFRPLPHAPDQRLARQLSLCQPQEGKARKRFHKRFDMLLSSPLCDLETSLRWAIDRVGSKLKELDWVSLTDDLSFWERDAKRLEWAKDFLNHNKGDLSC